MKPFLLNFWLLLFIFSLIAWTACIPPARREPELPPQRQKVERSADEGPSTATTRTSPTETESGPRLPDASSKDIILIPKEFAARVVGVYDGDTITVLDNTKRQHKIRLSGIDAPELRQDFGRRAKEHLSGLVFDKNVLITHDKVDRWGRIVGKVILDGQDTNLAMIEAGLAWHFKRYEKEQSKADRIAYANAETTARGASKGLWGQANAIAPWDSRTNK